MSNTIDVLDRPPAPQARPPGTAFAHRDAARHGLPVAMSLLRLERARARLALFGALLPRSSSSLLGSGSAHADPQEAFKEIDGELYTLAVAIGSDYRARGSARRGATGAQGGARGQRLRVPARQPLGDPLSAARSPSRSPATSSDQALPGASARTATVPRSRTRRSSPTAARAAPAVFSSRTSSRRPRARRSFSSAGSDRTCARSRRLDRALAGFVILGFLGTAAILACVVTRALKPVEEVTSLAERVEATDLSRARRVPTGGEEFRRLAAVINSLLERLENAFRAQRRLIADAAHELKTPTAVLSARRRRPCGADATPEGGTTALLETIEEVSRGLAREVDGLLASGARRRRARTPRREELDSREVAEERCRRRPPSAQRGVVCALLQERPARVRGDRAAWCGWRRTSSPTRFSTRRGQMVEVASAKATEKLRRSAPTGAPGSRRMTERASSNASCGCRRLALAIPRAPASAWQSSSRSSKHTAAPSKSPSARAAARSFASRFRLSRRRRRPSIGGGPAGCRAPATARD